MTDIWSTVRWLVQREGVSEEHAWAIADVVRIEWEKAEAAARAPLLAERDALRAALTLSIDFVDRVQTYVRMNRQDPRAPGPMETAAAALLTTLRAALTPPAPGVGGGYHPDPAIDAEVRRDAIENERFDLAAGYPPRWWVCPSCGASHRRGWFIVEGQHRCLRCGYTGDGGTMHTNQPPAPAAGGERSE